MTWRGEIPAYAQRGGNQSAGYYTGYGPLNGGSGSGMGQSVSGTSSLASGQGVTLAGQTWHPTVLYLVALTLGEMVVFAFIGRLLK